MFHMHYISHALIGLFGHCPEAKTHFTVSNPKHGFKGYTRFLLQTLLSLSCASFQVAQLSTTNYTQRMFSIYYLMLIILTCQNSGDVVYLKWIKGLRLSWFFCILLNHFTNLSLCSDSTGQIVKFYR